MKNEVQVIDPKAYGLEKENVTSIEEAFAPKIAEREGYEKIYAPLLTREISPEMVSEARDLRLKLVKTRTGISGIHKTQKAFYLAAGKFVDAWKNKETLPVVQMEEKLQGIEDHFENIERDRLTKLQKDREEEVGAYIDDASERNLSAMELDVWEAYLEAKRKAFQDELNAKKKAEEERVDAERIENLRLKRAEEITPYYDFFKEDYSKKLGKLSENVYQNILSDLKVDKSNFDKEQERIRKENEELKKAADEKVKSDEAELLERERLAKAEADKRAKIEADRLAREAKLKAENDAKLNAERLERERIQKELDDKKAAEEKAKADEEIRVQSELNKGDAAKVKDLISDLNILKEKYSFKSVKNRQMYSNVGGLIDKVTNFINK